MSALADIMVSWLMAPSSSGRDGSKTPSARARGIQVDTQASSEDSTTLVGLRAGDAATYDRVFRAHYDALVAFAMSFLHDQDHSEEVVGHVFVWLYEHRTTLKVSGSLRGYLFGAVRNAALNARRGRNREIARYTRIQEVHRDSVVPAAILPPDQLFAVTESNARLRVSIAHALDQLPDQARLVLALRLHRGLGYGEIAEALGISQVAAKQRFSRAVAALRTLLPDLLD